MNLTWKRRSAASYVERTRSCSIFGDCAALYLTCKKRHTKNPGGPTPKQLGCSKTRISQKPGRPKNPDVQKSWTSQKLKCPLKLGRLKKRSKNLDVAKTRASQKPGRPKNYDIPKTPTSKQTKFPRTRTFKNLNVPTTLSPQNLDVPKSRTSRKPGHPKNPDVPTNSDVPRPRMSQKT